MTSRGSSEEKRQRAQSHFEKGEQRRVEAAKSVVDHRAKINADAAKTIRLRALRLAKEAADALEAQRLSADMQATISASQGATPKKARRKKVPAAGP